MTENDRQLNKRKKIVQLTKVVYRLNTSNENHRSEKQLMLVRHQLDLQHVARDAAHKLAKFKDFVERRKIASGLEAQMENILHHMAKEKHDARMALIGYKQYIHEREIKLGLEYRYTIEQQQKDIRHMQQSFQEKLALVSGFTEELTLALQAQKANMFTSAKNADEYQQELTRKHEQAIAAISINHNQQMQQLLSKHQHEINQLIAEHRDVLQREETVLQNACNDEIASTHVQWCDDRQQAIVKLRKEVDNDMARLEQNHALVIDAIRNELAEKTVECEVLMSEKDVLVQQLQRVLTESESASERIQDAAQQMTLLQQDLDMTQQNNHTLLETIEKRDELLSQLESQITNQEQTLVQLEVTYQKVKREMLGLGEELGRYHQGGVAGVDIGVRGKDQTKAEDSNSSVIGGGSDGIGVPNVMAANLSREVHHMSMTVRSLQEELQQQEQAGNIATAELHRVIEVLTSERDAVRALVDKSSRQVTDRKQSSTDEHILTQRQKNEHDRRCRELLANVEEEHRQALEYHRQQASSELAHVQASIQGLEEEMQREEGLHIDRLESIQREYEGRVVSLREAYQQTAQEARARHGSARALLEAQLSEMTLAQQTKALSTSNTNTTAITTTNDDDDGHWEHLTMLLQQELELAIIETHRHVSLQRSLEEDLRGLREEFHDAGQIYPQDESYQADAAAQLQSDWSAQLAVQTEELEKARLMAIMSAETTGQRAWQEAMQKQEDDRQRMQGLVDKAKVALEEAQMNVSEAKARERESIHSNINSNINKSKENRSKVEVKEADRRPPPSQEQWHGPLTDDQTAAMEALDRKHAQDLESVRQSVVEAQEAHAAVLTASMEEAQDQLVIAVRAERQRCLALHAQALQDVQLRYSRELEARRDDTETSMSALSETISHMKDNIEALSDVVREGERLLLEEKADRATHAEQSSMDLQRLQRDLDAVLRNELADRSKRVSGVAQRTIGQRQSAEAKHRKDLAEYEYKLQEAVKEHQSLERQWLIRSSRPEDKNHIAQLEVDLKEKDEILARSIQELNYFKREVEQQKDKDLLLPTAEGGYGQGPGLSSISHTTGSIPLSCVPRGHPPIASSGGSGISVMQVIKPKTSSSAAVTAISASSSTAATATGPSSFSKRML